MRTKIPFAVALLASATLSDLAHALDVPASDPNIQYFGRWEISDPANPKTSWGHGIRVNFTGTSISVKADSTGTNGIYYEYSVDGAPFQTVNASGPMTFAVASGLSPGSHSLEFRRRLEASYGMTTFQGLVIDDGAALEAPRPLSSLQVEFIGDSITAGFGAEGQQSVTTDNINATWAAKLAAKLGADRKTVARSGIGISIDVNGTELSMRKRYPDTHFVWGGSAPKWDFDSWQPNGVFILLGTNDYVFGSPTPAQFEGEYSGFIGTVRTNYPSAHIFVVNLVQGRTTPAAKWAQAETSLRKIVADLNNAGDANVHFVDPGEGLVNADFSDTTHPLPSGHEIMATNLFALVEPILGTGSNPAPPPTGSPSTPPSSASGGSAGMTPGALPVGTPGAGGTAAASVNTPGALPSSPDAAAEPGTALDVEQGDEQASTPGSANVGCTIGRSPLLPHHWLGSLGILFLAIVGLSRRRGTTT